MRLLVRRHAVVVTAIAAGFVVVLAATPTAAAAVENGPITAHRVVPTAIDHHYNNSTTPNWAGYAVTGGRYTSVSATWTQPAVNCQATGTNSSFWVGIDGLNTTTVEQTGTEANCVGGSPQYWAWYEMAPAAEVRLSGPEVRPGDVFYASVTTDGSGSFTLSIKNQTLGWSYSVGYTHVSAKLASAEVIAEAPSASTGKKAVLPLSDFGTVNFSGATANGTSFGSPTAASVALNSTSDGSSTGVLKASAGSITPAGDFSVTWNHT